MPYKGPAAVVTAVLGGEIPIGIGASPAVLPMVQAKRVVALGVTSLNRLGAAPAIPTIAESGFPGFEVINNHGILAPAGTPRGIVKVLNAEIQSMLRTEEAKARLQSQGVEPAGSTPEEFGNIVKAEFARWTKVIREARITVGP